MEFLTPLSICKAKVGDTLAFRDIEETPFVKTLTVLSADETVVIIPPVESDTTRSGEEFWFLELTEGGALDNPHTYYTVIIDDNELTGMISKKFMIYVTDENKFCDKLEALASLNQNVRKVNWTYQDGLPTGYEIFTYKTAADLDEAEAGTANNFLANYQATIKYNRQFNTVNITVVDK